MDVNDNACFLNKRVAFESIASNRASTGCSYNYQNPTLACTKNVRGAPT